MDRLSGAGSNFGALQLISPCAPRCLKNRTGNAGNDSQKRQKRENEIGTRSSSAGSGNSPASSMQNTTYGQLFKAVAALEELQLRAHSAMSMSKAFFKS